MKNQTLELKLDKSERVLTASERTCFFDITFWPVLGSFIDHNATKISLDDGRFFGSGSLFFEKKINKLIFFFFQ